MKLAGSRQWFRNQTTRLALVGFCTLNMAVPTWAQDTTTPVPEDDTWYFIIMGDHRCVATKDTVNGDKNGWTDQGVNEYAIRDLARIARKEKALFVLDVGDMVAKYDKALLTSTTADPLITTELNYFTDLWKTYSADEVTGEPLPIYPVRGNHEASASAAAYLAGIANLPGIKDLPMTCSAPGEQGLTYAFTYKNCLFVALDVFPADSTKLPGLSGKSPTLSGSTLTWLSQLLADSGAQHIFVYGHTPAYEVWDTERPGWSRDGLASPRPKTLPATPIVLDDAAINAVRDPFWNLLGSKNANYYCGHDHLYLRGFAPSALGTPVEQVIMGNGGAPAYPQYPVDPFVESSKITKEYMDQNGSLGKISYGYLLVKVHGGGTQVTCTYKVESSIGGVFKPKDRWTPRIKAPEIDEEGVVVVE